MLRFLSVEVKIARGEKSLGGWNGDDSVPAETAAPLGP
jgi:hypothetical protein